MVIFMEYKMKEKIDRLISIEYRIFKIYNELMELDKQGILNDNRLDIMVRNLKLCISVEDSIIEEMQLDKERIEQIIQLFSLDHNVFCLEKGENNEELYNVFDLNDIHYLLYSNYDITKMKAGFHPTFNNIVKVTAKNPILRRIMRKIISYYYQNPDYLSMPSIESSKFRIFPYCETPISFVGENLDIQYTLKTTDYMEQKVLNAFYFDEKKQYKDLYYQILYLTPFLNPSLEKIQLENRFSYEIFPTTKQKPCRDIIETVFETESFIFGMDIIFYIINKEDFQRGEMIEYFNVAMKLVEFYKENMGSQYRQIISEILIDSQNNEEAKGLAYYLHTN